MNSTINLLRTLDYFDAMENIVDIPTVVNERDIEETNMDICDILGNQISDNTLSPPYTSSSEISNSPVYIDNGLYNENGYVTPPPDMYSGDPYLKILNQPGDQFRFRYKSESKGIAHGSIIAKGYSKKDKIFPAVKLMNFTEHAPVKIYCWLITEDADEVKPHIHTLVQRNKNSSTEESIERTVSAANNYVATFDNMVIFHEVVKEAKTSYKKKIQKYNKLRQQNINNFNSSGIISSKYTSLQYFVLVDDKYIKNKVKEINKNRVKLLFEAVLETKGERIKLCEAISDTIRNLKNAETSDLKIIKTTKHKGKCDGNEEVWLMVEKIPKEVEIVFYEEDSIWMKIIKPSYIHHCVCIIFSTPPYHNLNIDKEVKVKYYIRRVSDDMESGICEFTYLPSSYPGSSKKRKIMDYSDKAVSPKLIDNVQEPMLSSASLPSDEIPEEFKHVKDMLLNNDEVITTSFDFDSGLLNSNNTEDIAGVDLSHLRDVQSDGVSYSDSEILVPQCADESIHYSLPIANAKNPESWTQMPRDEYSEDYSVPGNSVKFFKNNDPKIVIVDDATLTPKIMQLRNNLRRITNDCDNRIGTELHHALLNSNTHLALVILLYLKELVDNRHDRQIVDKFLNFLNSSNQSVLHFAVMYGNGKIVEEIMKHNIDANILDSDGNSALHLAVNCDDVHCIKAIIAKDNTDLNILNSDGDPPLILAVKKRHHKSVAVLMTRASKINVNYRNQTDGDTVIHHAVYNNDIGILKLLTSSDKIDVNIVNFYNKTPLDIAIKLNSEVMCKYLFENKAITSFYKYTQQKRFDDNDEDVENDDDDDDENENDDDENENDDDDDDDDYYFDANDSCEINSVENTLKITRIQPFIETDVSYSHKIFDDDVTKRLIESLDKNSKWISVAKKLEEDGLIAVWKKLDSPTKALLNYLELEKCDSDYYNDKLISIFEDLNYKKEINIVKNRNHGRYEKS